MSAQSNNKMLGVDKERNPYSRDKRGYGLRLLTSVFHRQFIVWDQNNEWYWRPKSTMDRWKSENSLLLAKEQSRGS